jgi:pyridoxine 5'-phosphate synthase PdxJ
VPTRANGQPATGVYVVDSVTRVARTFGLPVISVHRRPDQRHNRLDNAALGGTQTSA